MFKRAQIKRTILDEREALEKKERLLRRASYVLKSIIKGLEEIDLETRQKILKRIADYTLNGFTVTKTYNPPYQPLKQIDCILSLSATMIRQTRALIASLTRCRSIEE